MVDPGHRADQAAGDAGQGDPGEVVTGRGGAARPPGPGREGRHHQPGPQRGARVGRVEPGDQPFQGLVGDERQGADPVGVPQRVGPELPRRVRRDQHRRHGGRERGRHRRHGGPVALRHQQVQHEDAGGQLHRRGQPHGHPAEAPAAPHEQPEIQQYQEQQQHVDLAEADRLAERFEDGDDAGRHRDGEPAGPAVPGGHRPQEPVEHHEGARDGPGDGRCVDRPPGKDRHRRHGEGGERRVREAVLAERLDVVVDLAVAARPVVHRAVVDLEVERAMPHRERGKEPPRGTRQREHDEELGDRTSAHHSPCPYQWTPDVVSNTMALGYVRPARPDEADEIARIQLSTWRTAYRRLLPRHVLDEMEPQWLAQPWRAAVEAPPSDRHRVLVAVEQAGASYLVGFAAIGPADEAALAPGEEAGALDAGTAAITELLVEPRWGRRGHGSRLLAASVDLWREDGFGTAVAWAYERDAATLAFLTGAGWAPDGAHRALDVDDLLVPQRRLHVALGA